MGKEIGDSSTTLKGSWFPRQISMNQLYWKKKMGKRKEQEALSESLTQINEQLIKLGRLQYKSRQDLLDGLNQLGREVGQVVSSQEDNGNNVELIKQLTKNQQQLVNILLLQLDELDVASSGLKLDESDTWGQLLRKWTERIVTSLAELDIYEMNLVGRSFSPEFAEGVGTVLRTVRSYPETPYEISSIVKRGFMYGDHRIFRKAQVITYQEGER